MPITSVIRNIAHALPTGILTNDELASRFGQQELEPIIKMAGINNRRVLQEGLCASDLGLAAAKRLLEYTKIDPESIDLITFASQTPDYRIPATACVLHSELGLPESCCTMDISQACSSFFHNIQVAHSMLVSGTCKRALIINADSLSTLIHPMDRSLVTLHGDAAVATIVEACDSEKGGLEKLTIGTDSSQWRRILVPAGGSREPCSEETRKETMDDAGCVRTREDLYMDGPAIFHFAIHKIPRVIKAFMADNNYTMDDFDLFLLHQANQTMVDMIYKMTKTPEEKRFCYLSEVGNASGASLPMLLSQAWREGKVRPGSRTLLCAFGGGLSWGVASIKWPEDANAAVPGCVDVACERKEK